MYNKRISSLVFRHLFAAKDKPPKLSTELPPKLLQINPLEDTEAWFKALVKHLRKEIGLKGSAPKVSVVENLRGDAQSIMFGLSKNVNLQADLGSSGRLVQNIRGRSAGYDLSMVEGIRNYYSDMVQTYAQEEAILNWFPTLTDKLQSYTGLGLNLTTQVKDGFYYGTWSTLKNPALDASFQVKTRVDGTDLSWTLKWEPDGGVEQISTSNSLSVLLEDIPEEYDSEMVWFTSDTKKKELQKTLKSILGLKRLPRVWSDDEGAAGITIKEQVKGKLADTQYTIEIDYRNKKQEWWLPLAAKILNVPTHAGRQTLEDIHEALSKGDPVYEFLAESVHNLPPFNIMAYTDKPEYVNVAIEAYSTETSLEDVLSKLKVLAECSNKLMNEPFVMYEKARAASLVTRHLFAHANLKPIKSTKLSSKLLKGPQSEKSLDIENWLNAVIAEAKKSLSIPKAKVTAEVLNKDAENLQVTVRGPEGIFLKSKIDAFEPERMFLMPSHEVGVDYDLSNPSSVAKWYVKEILTPLAPLASFQWLKTLLPRIQAAVGMSFREELNYPTRDGGAVLGYWLDVEKTDIGITISASLLTNPDFSVTQEWQMAWKDTKNGNQVIQADSIEDLLLQLPGEFDSESVFFTDKKGLANLKSKFQDILGPQIQIEVNKRDFKKTLSASVELSGDLAGYDKPASFYGNLTFDNKRSLWRGYYYVITSNYALENREGKPIRNPNITVSKGAFGKYLKDPVGKDSVRIFQPEIYTTNLEEMLDGIEDLLATIKDLADHKIKIQV